MLLSILFKIIVALSPADSEVTIECKRDPVERVDYDCKIVVWSRLGKDW